MDVYPSPSPTVWHPVPGRGCGRPADPTDMVAQVLEELADDVVNWVEVVADVLNGLSNPRASDQLDSIDLENDFA